MWQPSVIKLLSRSAHPSLIRTPYPKKKWPSGSTANQLSSWITPAVVAVSDPILPICPCVSTKKGTDSPPKQICSVGFSRLRAEHQSSQCTNKNQEQAPLSTSHSSLHWKTTCRTEEESAIISLCSVCIHSTFSLNILLSVALIIHLLVITVPISKYWEINNNT